jgi:uncharacterized protein (TIGR00255 family)
MTGFARSSGAVGDFLWTWEVKSVNGRSLDVRSRLPQGYEAFEAIVRQAASEHLKRGNLSVSLTVDDGLSRGRLAVNRAALTQILELIAEISPGLKAAPPSLDGILALKGVLEVEPVTLDETAQATRKKALDSGLDAVMRALDAMRRDEGLRLRSLVLGHLDEIERLRVQALGNAATQPAQIQARIETQLRELMPGGVALEPERLAQEVALIVARADIREEIDRLGAHVAAARDLVAAGGAIGRKLDFLCQEFNREANTLCAKAANIALTNVGIEIKAAIEQMREQIQNIE